MAIANFISKLPRKIRGKKMINIEIFLIKLLKSQKGYIKLRYFYLIKKRIVMLITNFELWDHTSKIYAEL